MTYIPYDQLTEQQKAQVTAQFDPRLADPKNYGYELNIYGGVLCRKLIARMSADEKQGLEAQAKPNRDTAKLDIGLTVVVSPVTVTVPQHVADHLYQRWSRMRAEWTRHAMPPDLLSFDAFINGILSRAAFGENYPPAVQDEMREDYGGGE